MNRKSRKIIIAKSRESLSGSGLRHRENIKLHTAVRNPLRSIIGSDRGVVLILALCMLVVLSLLGAVVMNLSGVDLQTAAYEKMSNWAFLSAESGVTQARSDMQTYIVNSQSGQWPALDTTVESGVLGGNTAKNYTISLSGQPPVSFSYSIADFGAVDDRTVLVTSTGTLQNVQQRVEAVIRYEPPDQVGSQECYSAKCRGVDQTSGKKVVNSENSTVEISG